MIDEAVARGFLSKDSRILLPDPLIAIEVSECVAWFDPDYWSLEDFLDTAFLA